MRWIAAALIPLLAGCPMKTPVVNNFQGENAVLAESLLPPNVSPDALNCDYRNGTIRKRSGWASRVWLYDTNTDPWIAQSGIVRDMYSDPSGRFYALKKTGATTNKLFRILDLSTGGWDELGSITSSGFGRIVDAGGSILVADAQLKKYRVGFYDMNPGQPAIGSAAAAGSGSGSLTGTRRYKFVFRNSVDSSEGLASAEISSTGVSSSAQIDLTAIPTTADAQVDKVDIYATELASGTVFYYLATVNEGTTTYTDTTTDATLVGNEPFDEYRGTPPTGAVDAFWWDDRLWFVYADGVAYTERATGDLSVDGMAVYSRFYADNFIASDQQNSRAIVAAVVTGPNSVLLVAQDRLLILQGAGPGLYAINTLAANFGAPYRAGVCVGDNAVYIANSEGVWAIGLPYGTPQNITAKRIDKAEFSVSSGTPVCLAFNPVEQRLYASVSVGGDAYMWVWDKASDAWSKWDIPADYVDVGFLSGDATLRTVIAAGPLLGKLNAGTVDGLLEDYGFLDDPTIEGTVDSATATTIRDDSALMWYFDGGGLANWQVLVGMRVHIEHPSGATEWRTITATTESPAPILTVDSAWTTTPAAGTPYWIGGIDWRWRTPALDLSGDRSEEIVTDRLHVWFRNPTANVEVSVAHKAAYESVTAPNSPYTLDASVRRVEVIAKVRGDEQTFEFSNPYPEQPVEIEAFQIEYQRTKADTTND